MTTDPVPATNFSASWTRVDQTSDPSFYSALLQATRAQLLDEARRDPGAVLAPLELRPGLRLLDVGCGTGDYLQVMAPLITPGPAIGIDLSATLITAAQQRIAPETGNVSFQVGDAYDLPFPDRSFDRVVATQVLLHLTEPWRAVQEIRRVLVPGGLVSIGEWDWDSVGLALSDRDLGRRFTHLLCDQMHGGLIVRDLSWRLARYGFTEISLTPQVRISRDLDAAYTWLIEPAARQLVQDGLLTQAEGARLLDELGDRAANGRYFLSRTYYSVIAIAG